MRKLGTLMLGLLAACGSDARGGPQDAGLDASEVAEDAGSSDAAEDASASADAALSCAPDDAGAPSACRYLSTDGTAVVTSIELPGPGPDACPRDPRRVSFRFEPDDPSSVRCAVDGTGAARTYALTVGDGKAPPRACLDATGTQTGSRLRVRRRDLVQGTCTPVVFVFDRALSEACREACF